MVHLLDTNVALLWILGMHGGGAAITRHRRTADLDQTDLDVLNSLLGRAPRFVTTAAILTEISNLLGDRNDSWRVWAPVVASWMDRSTTLPVVLEDPALSLLGFADAMTVLAADSATHVITRDGALYNVLLARGRTVTNFNHLRRPT